MVQSSPKVALIHDWLNGMRGGERCLEAFLELYPKADIFTLFHVPGATSETIDARVKDVSVLDRVPGARRWYRYLLPFYPFAIRQFDLRGYDLVVSLSHAAAKNVVVPKGTSHICYCFTPMRYIWDQANSYFGALTPLLWPVIQLLRAWDRSSSRGVQRFVAISRFVSARIRRFYGRSADVIFPPVDTSWISSEGADQRGEAFLYAGALVPYKRPDVVVEAFNRLGVPLWIVGSGPMESKLREMAQPNIRFLGRLSDEELAERYRRCRALLFPGKEDFGMIPIECLAAGRPVIGLHAGALRESLTGVKPWRPHELRPEEASGVFFRVRKDEDPVGPLLASIRYFLDHEEGFRPEQCKERAQVFSPERFRSDWRRLVQSIDPELIDLEQGRGPQGEQDAQAEATAL